MTKKYDVFINYNFKDVLAVDVLEARLKAHGIRCWRDEWEMLAGDDIVTSLREGIEESSIVIVFVGRNSLGPWQKREIVSAQVEQRIQKNKQLIPVFFPGPSKEEREKLADFLKTPLGVVFGHLDEKAPFEKLLKSIQGKLLAQEPGREFLACDDSALPRRELQNPYKGLSKFLEGDEETFFGREQATEVLMEKMERALSTPEKARLFVLTGASGCGKSSLARAGLMAGLKRKWGDTWCYATVDHPGNNPLNELATKLSGETRLPFEAELHADFRALDSKMSQCILDGSDGKFVLLVDQFEEVFTLCENADKGRSFMANLLFAASKDNGKGIVLLTLRSEFWQSFMDAVEAEKKACNGKASLFKESSIQPVAPMDREELRQAIEAPAQQMGVGYEAALLEKLLEDAGAVRKDANAREGILPLLQVALEELWQFRSPHHISYGAYQETGGIRGALEKRANDIYGGFNEAQRRMAQHIFLNLLRINPDAPETRQRVGVDEFSVKGHTKEEVAKVVQKLVDGRLLVSDKGEVEIIHEALIHHWSVLRDWVESKREGLKRKQQIEDRAKLWQSASGDLLTGNTLATALAWEEEDAASAVPLGLNAKAREFLEASRKHQEDERQKENTRLRRQRMVYAVFTAFMTVLAVVAAFMWKESNRQRFVTEVRHLTSSALLEQDRRVDLSLLLAMASIQEMEATGNPALAESESALLSTLQAHPQLDSYLHGHTGAVYSLAFSPDGSRLASASSDGTVTLWDVEQRQALETFREHRYLVQHLSFSPDGSLLTASKDKTVIWDVKQQKRSKILREHEDMLHPASFSQDGSLLASASKDNTILLWDLKQPQTWETLRGHDGKVRHLSFSPDGRVLASAGEDSTILLYNLKQPQKLETLRGHDGWVSHLSFSQDGSLLASASRDNTIILWDVNQRQKLETFREHEIMIEHLSFSPDGRVLASAGSDRKVILWDVKKRQKLATLRGHTASVRYLSFSPDGSLLASASWDKTVILWDVQQQQALTTLRGHDDWVEHLSFSPDGGLLVSASRNKTLILWDVQQQQSLATLLGHYGKVHHLSFSPEGSLLASASRDNTAILWDVEKQEALKTLDEHKGPVEHFSFSPDGRVLASASNDRTVTLWDMEKQEALKTLDEHKGLVRHLSFSPDGNLLASASEDNTVILWDVKKQQKLEVLCGHDGWVMHLSFSPDGRVLASAGNDRKVILWDVEKRQKLETLRGHTDTINHLSFSPDGRVLASASRDRTVILWNVKQRQALTRLRRHGDVVVHLSFSPDGSLLASASRDNTIILWDVKRQQSLATLREHHDWIQHLSFSPDGKQLASAGIIGTIKLWDVSRASWRERARKIANRNMTLEEWRTHMGERTYRKIFEDLPGPLDAP